MKPKKAGFLLSLSIMCVALFSPLVAEASCPLLVVECPGGKLTSCPGTQQGDKCIYSADCLNGGKCKAAFEETEVN